MGKHFWGRKAIEDMIRKMNDARDAALNDVDNLHVKLQQGNSKTGRTVMTVSLLPIIDCKNCDKCMWQCYDVRNDVYMPKVLLDRAKNSAIHSSDPKRFWDEVSVQIKANFVETLRINVGGDLEDDDFFYVNELAKNNPRTDILFFTKNYKGINSFMENNTWESNVHPIMSAWQDMEMENPNNLPCSHVLYEDGRTTAPTYGAFYCGGNCSECHFNNEGCWNLKNGEHVIFKVH